MERWGWWVGGEMKGVEVWRGKAGGGKVEGRRWGGWYVKGGEVGRCVGEGCGGWEL